MAIKKVGYHWRQHYAASGFKPVPKFKSTGERSRTPMADNAKWQTL